MSATKSCPNSNRLDEGQVKNLANPLVEIIKDFYNNPDNMEEFNKWLLSVEQKQ
jgi:hypothetical protein